MTAAVVVVLVILMLAGLNVLMALWDLRTAWFNWLVAGLCIGMAAGVIKEMLDR